MKIISALLRCNLRIRSCAVAMLACNAVPVCLGKAGIFVETGDLATARYGHTATLLPSGKVLAAGGIGLQGGEVESAELYDPENGMWMPTGSLANARGDHIATLLPNGKVLVAGGAVGSSSALASSELYDPATGIWSTTGHLAVARYFFTATLLPNGKVLVAGGENFGVLAEAELYDPQNGIWAPTGSLMKARASHTATLLPNGKVLVAGGVGVNSAQTAELYDPESGTWTLTGSLVWEHTDHTATLLPNGKVLLSGFHAGSTVDAELYDPASGTWRSTENLITPRYQHTATLLANGKVLVVAGWDNGSTLGSGELYDPMNETWSAVQNEVYPGRTYHTATLLSNGQVLVAGGAAEFGQVFNSAQLYISGSSQPASLRNLSTRLDVLTGDKIGIGGFIISGTDSKTVLIRGIGPSLSGFLGGGTIADPTLALYQGSTVITSNDNWKLRPNGSSQQAEIEATGIPPTNDLESAILATLSPDAYTTILAGKNGETGVGLVEVYDLGQEAHSKLANLSTRGVVDTGDNIMIAGLILGGGTAGVTSHVMVRALGPSVPVPGALGDPTLELRDGNGTLVASNDNWKMRPDGSSQQAEIEATGLAPTNDLESALVQTLSAGNYTGIMQGVNNTRGVGLVEVY